MREQTVAVFHAHPDDEVFGTAAATSALAAAGAEVRLFVATGGELPEQGADPRLDQVAARRIREGRLDRSCKLLGIERWGYLTRPGQWVDSTEWSRTLAAAPTEVVAAAVRGVLDEQRPEIVLSVGPDGLTGHPDHVAMHDAVAAALQLPGWSPRHAWGAVVVDADVRAANASIAQLLPAAEQHAVRRDTVTGVAAADIVQTFGTATAGVARRRAMDLYLDGLGTAPVDRLIEHHRLRGASLTLRAVFDRTGGDKDYFTSL
ncbi:PIG-L deacetylase family protein [Microlunatus soli]|uniref:GlcNAc-PI de-N-acetylase n=1 Tax=Microlunatus soli TaxID=630515 RepID=A0A1H1Y3X8_9ACTN|nr:PIG-L family deacetylase [Microlunatus soli]SDT16124.1 GlcNAc-PI de-N-acetylase [Microlunatus soli]